LVACARAYPVVVAAFRYPPVDRPLRNTMSERLILRRMRTGDETVLGPVFAKPEVWAFPFGRGFTAAETKQFVDSQVADWDAMGFGVWLTIERATSAVLGFIGLSVPRFLPEILPAVEVGWRIDPDVWGRGYATEGASVALEEAFWMLGLSEVHAVSQPDNHRSVRLAERLGMRLRRNVALAPTERRDAVAASLFSMTRLEWEATRNSSG
jgi:RimJ/RimL family protein N-acetyltransferase